MTTAQQSEALRLADALDAYAATLRTLDLSPKPLDDAAALLRRMHALTTHAGADGWQPISEAPKNERESVLVSDGQAVGEAFWHDGSQCYGHRGKAGWFWEADRDSLLTARNAHVTHYRPLPAPPAPEALEVKRG